VNPSQGRVPSTGIEVRISQRVTLPGRAWCADEPRALVAIVHGLGEHSGRYAALAEPLVAAGYTVVALDLPGHGESPGPRGDIASWIEVRETVVPAMFTASRGLPGQPLELRRVLLGHSMGGLMALDYALVHPRQLMAVVASAPALKSAMPPWWKLALANVARATAPSLGFPDGLEEAAMSRDRQVVDLRHSDPLMHDRISPRLYFAIEEARQRVMRDARRLSVPTLLLHGAADRVVDPRGTLEFCGAAPHGMSRLLTLREGYHEVFNDTTRDEAIKDLIAWLDAVRVV
jgi:alpha-beta hydrolase superfamily lysophospholipase